MQTTAYMYNTRTDTRIHTRLQQPRQDARVRSLSLYQAGGCAEASVRRELAECKGFKSGSDLAGSVG